MKLCSNSISFKAIRNPINPGATSSSSFLDDALCVGAGQIADRGRRSRCGRRPKGFWEVYLKWYAYWLKGDTNGITDMPHVQYYLMGRNEWRSADAWPIPGTEFRRYYLHSGGGPTADTATVP